MQNTFIEIFDETKETANFETFGGTLSDLSSSLLLQQLCKMTKSF
jgi:NifU-like protein involved in Fe-S cluster formation